LIDMSGDKIGLVDIDIDVLLPRR